MDAQEIRARAAEHWSKVSLSASTTKRHWWQSPCIVGHINSLVSESGDMTPGLHLAFHKRIANMLNGRKVPKAISIGCGVGSKEMSLVQMGIVEHFDLFEISDVRIQQGIQRATALGIADKITFHQTNVFDEKNIPDYELVYWNNSLHHMLDVDEAIAWSLEHLASGGMFAMDDFIGPSRFQYTDRMMEYASRVRGSLPEVYLQNPENREEILPKHAHRPSIKGMIAMDPTEAADSGRILESLKKRIKDFYYMPTGGAIYVVALKGILGNFNEVEDYSILYSSMIVDRILAETGDTLYAVAIARV